MIELDEHQPGLVHGIINAAVHAFDEQDRVEKFEDLRFTSLTIALIADHMIRMGWPSRRPDSELASEPVITPDPLFGKPKPPRLIRHKIAYYCAVAHHQGCEGSYCGCACHPADQRYYREEENA